MKALCNKVMACGHTKCHQKKRAYLFLGHEINIFFKSLGVIGSSREGITIEATTLEDDKEYLVCDIFKTN